MSNFTWTHNKQNFNLAREIEEFMKGNVRLSNIYMYVMTLKSICTFDMTSVIIEIGVTEQTLYM